MKNIQTYLTLGAMGGLSYLLGRYLIFKTGNDFTAMHDWLFRLVLIIPISAAIISIKKKNKGFLSFKDAFVAGGFTATFMAIFMSISTGFYCEVINQTYTKDYEKITRDIHYNKMMRTYIYEKYGRDTITQEAQQTVNKGLDIYMKNVTPFYTTKGQVLSNLLHIIAWSLAIIMTIAMLNRRVKED